MRSSRKNHIAGVSLEPHVLAYLDDLAIRMRMNRSWVLNTIVHEYARFIEKKHLSPLATHIAHTVGMSVTAQAGSNDGLIIEA